MIEKSHLQDYFIFFYGGRRPTLNGAQDSLLEGPTDDIGCGGSNWLEQV